MTSQTNFKTITCEEAAISLMDQGLLDWQILAKLKEIGYAHGRIDEVFKHIQACRHAQEIFPKLKEKLKNK